jgi:hypothetical protein
MDENQHESGAMQRQVAYTIQTLEVQCSGLGKGSMPEPRGGATLTQVRNNDLYPGHPPLGYMHSKLSGLCRLRVVASILLVVPTERRRALVMSTTLIWVRLTCRLSLSR